MFALKTYRRERTEKPHHAYARFLAEPGDGTVKAVVLQKKPHRKGMQAHDSLFPHLNFGD
ncbi:MAG: hypothetical protein PHY92_08920 [Alphaproteobacteria bacterium]|nr:hypothetical protein [Alphaproteobacteria bacterium]